jgi:hypothetical protein
MSTLISNPLPFLQGLSLDFDKAVAVQKNRLIKAAIAGKI